MKTAIITNKNDFTGVVTKMYREGEYLLIIDDEKNDEIINVYSKNDVKEDSSIYFAKKILENDCEVVICGEIEKEPFIIIADEGCVTRYNGAGYSSKKAFKRMNENKLTLIKAYIGGTGCDDSEDNRECGCEE